MNNMLQGKKINESKRNFLAYLQQIYNFFFFVHILSYNKTTNEHFLLLLYIII